MTTRASIKISPSKPYSFHESEVNNATFSLRVGAFGRRVIGEDLGIFKG